MMSGDGTEGRVANVESLPAASREFAERVVRHVQARDNSAGVMVGVARGSEAWDIRPVVLETKPQKGVLTMIRLSEPISALPRHRAQLLRQILSAFSSPAEGVLRQRAGVIACGEFEGHVWMKRRWFARTAAEVLQAGVDAGPLHTVRFCQKLLSLVLALHGHGIVHGHLRMENIAIDGESPQLLDFGFFAGGRMMRAPDDLSAPELAGDHAIDALVDVYGLGKIFQQLLSDDATDEQRDIAERMCAPERNARPPLPKVAQVFMAQRVASIPGGGSAGQRASVRAQAPDGSMRSGKLLGERGGAGNVQGPVLGSATLGSATLGSATSGSGYSVAAPAASAGDRAVEIAVPRQKRKSPVADLILYAVVLLGVSIIGWKVFAMSPWGSARVEEMQLAWQSGDSQRMGSVARAAALEGDTAAREVIIDDILSGSSRPAVRTNLLRIAFHPRWRDALSADDQRLALTLALVGMLPQDVGSLPPLDKSHPGVILAVAGDLALNRGAGQFQSIPLSALSSLPPPYGIAASELGKLGVTSLADPVGRAASHVWVGNPSPEALAAYFSGVADEAEFLGRLLIVIPFCEVSPQLAPQLLDYFRQREDLFRKRVDWFDAEPVAAWHEADPTQRLYLAAGLFPEGDLTLERLSDLLKFPAAKIRSEAAKRLGARLPASTAAFVSFLISDQNTLSRESVVLLVFAVEALSRSGKNEEIHSLIVEWLQRKPGGDAVLRVLNSLSGVRGVDALVVELARYLSDKDLRAGLAELETLALHSEALARVQAYVRLNPKVPAERAILEKALAIEANERIKKDLEKRISGTRPAGVPQPGELVDLSEP